MTPDSIISQIQMLNPKGLRQVYEGICEEYRRRLNAQWELDIKDSWWIPSDFPGSALALNDLEYSLGMEDVRLLQPVFMTVNKNDVIVESNDLNPQDKESVGA